MIEHLEYKGHVITIIKRIHGVRTFVDGNQTDALSFREEAIRNAKSLIDALPGNT